MVDDALLNIGFAIARIAGFVANAFLFGLPVIYLVVIVPGLSSRGLEEPARERMASRMGGFMQSALIASAIASVVALVLQAVVIADFGGGGFGTRSMTDVFDTSFGRWYLLRFPLLIALAVLVWGKARPIAAAAGRDESRTRGAFWIAWIALGLVLLSTSSFSGHASVSSPRVPALLNDVVHMVSGSVWFVGIVMLAVVVPDVRRRLTAESRDRFVGDLMVRFSSVALVAITIVAGTGTLNSLFNVAELDDLWNSGYGGLLATKIALFLFVLVLGGINHFFVRRRFQRAQSQADGASAARLFRKTIGIELALALLIFTFTGALAGSARTRESAAPSMSGISRTV